jgi:hypothetical protein
VKIPVRFQEVVRAVVRASLLFILAFLACSTVHAQQQDSTAEWEVNIQV